MSPAASCLLVSWILVHVLAASPALADFAEGRAAYAAKDFEAAHKEFRTAAEQGHAEAQFWLGLMYERGQGSVQDFAEAARWYRRAAEQGNAVAQYRLGNLYFAGTGVAQNYVEAYKWLSLSVAQRPDSQHAWVLGAMEDIMTQMEVVEAKERARNWRPGPGN